MPLAADSPYGVTNQTYSSAQITALPTNLGYATTLGVAWVRPQRSWNQIELTQNLGPPVTYTYDWSDLDQIVQSVNNAGLRCCLVIQGGDGLGAPSWGLQAGVAPTPSVKMNNPTQMARFAGVVAARYNNATVPNSILGGFLHVEAIQIGNEEFATNCNYGADAAACVSAAYPIVKAAYASCLVGGAPCIGTQKAKIDTYYSAFFAGHPLCDWADFHYYGDAPNHVTGPLQYTFIGEAAAMRTWNALQFPGTPHIPIWCTETGFAFNGCSTQATGPFCVGSTTTHQITRTDQSNFTVQTMELGRLSAGLITHIFWYTVNPGDTYSIVGAGPTYFKAFTALQTEITTYPQWSGGQTQPSILFPATARRLGQFPATVRHLGQFPATQRRGA